MENLNFVGLLLGLTSFLIIGLFHPLVIKAEYHLGVKSWWIFLVMGLVTTVISLLLENDTWSTLCGIFAFSSFWSILEVFEQRKRVERGWFPKKPGR